MGAAKRENIPPVSPEDSSSTPESLNVSRSRGRPVGQSEDLTADELTKIISLPDRRTRQGLRDYAVLLAFLNTPMRKGELVRLKVGNVIDEKTETFITYEGLKKRSKKKYWLKIPIEREVFDGIVRYIKSEYGARRLKASEPLFYTLGKHGPYQRRPITPWAIDLIVQKYVRLAQIQKRITPHSFRASYLTLRESEPIGALLGLSGHASAQGITPYLRASQEKKRKAAGRYSFS